MLYAISANAAPTITDSDLHAILEAGHWGPQIEDNLDFYHEQLPASVIRDWVNHYDPAKEESSVAIGALVLTTAVANWGVSGQENLPTDPEGRVWQGPGLHNDAKHLISYALGGVGIDHTDSGSLEDFIDYVKEHHPSLAEKPEHYFKLRGITFDRIRANGGVCTKPRSEIKVDLNGQPFGHGVFPGGKKYCPLYQNKAKTTLEDWQIFRHWTRAALRQESVQRYMINRWIEREWLPSYRAVLAAGGTVEEAMINARIRNSSPKTAACAIKKAKGVSDRIKAELNAYVGKECGGNPRHKERIPAMMRPVVLYRHFHTASAIPSGQAKP
jgi:hypothetical protein